MSGGKSDSNPNDNGYLTSISSSGKQPSPRVESASFSISSEAAKVMDPRLEGSRRSIGSVSALKELVNSKYQCSCYCCSSVPLEKPVIFILSTAIPGFLIFQYHVSC